MRAKAMIFAAGLGTRLKPYTLSHPKALVPVGGIPMLQRVILKLKDAGIDEMIVNVHHFAGQIIDFLAANNNFGCTIHISDESGLLLDTGGGLRNAWRWLLDTDDSPIVVHNADILTDFDIDRMIMANYNSNDMATLLVDRRETSRYLLMDHKMRMDGWINVKTGQIRAQFPNMVPGDDGKYAFGGVHVIAPKMMPALMQYRKADEPFSIMDFYIDNCYDQYFRGYIPPKPYNWADIGKVDTLAAAEALLAKDKNP